MLGIIPSHPPSAEDVAMIDSSFLQSHALFGGISNEQITIVISHLEQQSFAAGSYLFRQGDSADRLFLICQGTVEVLDETNTANPVRLAVRGVGDSIGEMALIDVQNRSASIRTLEPVQTLSLSCHDLLKIHQCAPQLFTQIIINIAREISRRLRSMDALLSSALYDAGQRSDD
jgi:CRP-like cAMP-binding protein